MQYRINSVASRNAFWAAIIFVISSLSPSTVHAKCGGENQPICSTSSANKTESLVGCDKSGQFPDWISGECWACPSNTTRNLNVGSTKNACTGLSSRTKKMVTTYAGYKAGGWCSPVGVGDRGCCVSGWHDNKAESSWQASDACYKYEWKTTWFPTTDAEKVGNTACPVGQRHDGKGCYSCPDGYEWTLLSGATDAKACTATVLALCDKGLIPDFVNNKCVSTSMRTNACISLVNAIKAGESVAGLAETISTWILHNKMIKRQHLGKTAAKDAQALATKEIDRYKHLVPEMQRVVKAMRSKSKAYADLFSATNLCTLSGKEMSQKLVDLGLRPDFTKKKARLLPQNLLIRSAHAASEDHFYLGYLFWGGEAAIAGADGQLGFLFVTDFRGNTGTYFYLGPGYITNTGANYTPMGLQLYPNVNIDEFPGWGTNVAVSAGVPLMIVGVTVDFSWDDFFKRFEGFGFSASTGVDFSEVDVGFAADYAWKLKH